MGAARARISRRVLAVTIGVAIHAGSLRAEAAWTLTLVNETGTTLTFYDVNESPPPSRLPTDTIPDGGTLGIDPDGNNPVFAWGAGISLTGTDPNGFLIGLGLADTPSLIQYKLFHYKITPGEAGKDPDLQPILLDNVVVEVTEGEVEIVVDAAWNVTIGTPSLDNACCALDGCSEVGSVAACPDGTFISGVLCTPGLCTSASETIGSDGGTVETPDGSVSVDFPPDCLSDSTTITIEEGDYPSHLYDIELTGTRGADFNVHLAYTFGPVGLDFCAEAELCMSFDRTELGIDPADCSQLRFLHKDRLCGFDPDADCQTDADCPPGIACRDVVQEYAATCECPDTSSVGSCCTNINHFSDLVLVSPLEEDVQCWCLLRFCCGNGVAFVFPLMFATLVLVKASGAGFGRHGRLW